MLTLAEPSKIEQILSTSVVLFVYGSDESERGGVTNLAVDLLSECAPGAILYDVSRDRAIRKLVTQRSDWAFFPQLFVNGEYVGGYFVMKEYFASGEFGRVIGARADSRPNRNLLYGRSGPQEIIWRFAEASESGSFAGCAANGMLLLWGEDRKTPSRYQVCEGWANSVALSPCGDYAFVGTTEAEVVRIDTVDGVARGAPMRLERWVNDLAISRCGRRLWSGSADGLLVEWSIDSSTRRLARKAHDCCVWSIELSPDGRRLATGAADGTVSVWDTDKLERIASRRLHTSPVTSLSRMANGVSASSHDTRISLFDWELAEVTYLDGHRERAWGVGALDEGRQLVSGGGDGTVRFWDLEAGVQQSLTRFSANVTAVGFSRLHKAVCVAHADGSVSWIEEPWLAR